MCYLCSKDTPFNTHALQGPPSEGPNQTLLTKIAGLNQSGKVICESCAVPRHLDPETLLQKSRFHFGVVGTCGQCGNQKEFTLLSE